MNQLPRDPAVPDASSLIPPPSSFILHPSAFTLIELMISIALVVGLMIGVNYVFQAVGQATGSAAAMSQAARDAQGTQAVLSRDLNAIDIKNSPCILLRSYVTPAFMTKQDLLGAPDPTNPLTDVDPNNAAGTVSLAVTDPSQRAHRTDIFSFFARDQFSRQTGGTSNGTNQNPFVSDMSGTEAWVWYGHLRLPDNNGSFVINGTTPTDPGAGSAITNPNNYFATQWILGRVAMILQEPDSTPSHNIDWRQVTHDINGNPVSDNTLHQNFIMPAGFSGAGSLSPLAYNSPANAGGTFSSTGVTPRLENSRYDLLGTSINGYRNNILKPYIQANPTDPWWELFMLGNSGLGDRFWARPFSLGGAGSPPPARITPESVALQAPIFLNNCTQFIVEYAGDFVKQDPTTGAVTAACCDASGNYDPDWTTKDSDGQIDYVFDQATGKRQIRWYGFPRDADGDAVIPGTGAAVVKSPDVIPLRDVLAAAGISATFPFEKIGATAPGGPTIQAPNANYADPATGAKSPNPLPLVNGGGDVYTCAWGPNDPIRPSLIRILVGLDDPNGHLGQTQMFEFVFKVQ